MSDHTPPCKNLIDHLNAKSPFDYKFWITITVIILAWAVSAGILGEKVNSQERELTKYEAMPERLARFETMLEYTKQGVDEIKSDIKSIKRNTND